MVDVLVMVKDPVRHLDPPRKTVVPVEEQCFEPGKVCWKPIACIKAAVVLELPFTWMIEKAKFGLRQEDKIRLREMYGGNGETDSSTSLRMTGGENGGPSGAQAPTDEGEDGRAPSLQEREEETA